MVDLIGGAEGDRTPDLRIANAALCQTELLPHESENTVSSFEFQPEVSGFGFQVSGRDKRERSGRYRSRY